MTDAHQLTQQWHVFSPLCRASCGLLATCSRKMPQSLSKLLYHYSPLFATITNFGVYLDLGSSDSCSFLTAGKACSILPSSLSLTLIRSCLALSARRVLFISLFWGSLRSMTIRKGNVSLELQYCSRPSEEIADCRRISTRWELKWSVK